jgi:hypothetical protein
MGALGQMPGLLDAATDAVQRNLQDVASRVAKSVLSARSSNSGLN